MRVSNSDHFSIVSAIFLEFWCDLIGTHIGETKPNPIWVERSFFFLDPRTQKESAISKLSRVFGRVFPIFTGGYLAYYSSDLDHIWWLFSSLALEKISGVAAEQLTIQAEL